MYFYYPQFEEAYTFDKQYFFGDNMLVSPITQPGEVASTDVWFPEGMWTNFFTNEVVKDAGVKTISADFNSMAVFVKAGGIVPLKPYSDYLGQNPTDTLQLKLYTGGNGTFSLYEDEGTGLAYTNGQYAVTEMQYDDDAKEFTINPQQGSFTGSVTERTYTIEAYNILPNQILLNDEILPQIESNTGEGWWLTNGVIHIHLKERSVQEQTSIIFKEVTASIQGVDNKTGMNLYPNPSQSSFKLKLDHFSENVKLSIYDMNGKNVHEAHFNNRDEMSINTQSFAQGVYLVKVVTTNGIFSDKLLISN